MLQYGDSGPGAEFADPKEWWIVIVGPTRRYAVCKRPTASKVEAHN